MKIRFEPLKLLMCKITAKVSEFRSLEKRMDRCPVPWSDTTPPPPTVSSPSPRSPDALQLAYNSALGNEGVIRGPQNSPPVAEDQGLVYQSLDGSDHQVTAPAYFAPAQPYGFVKLNCYQDEGIAGKSDILSLCYTLLLRFYFCLFYINLYYFILCNSEYAFSYKVQKFDKVF